jgi:TonB-dependent receptor
MHILSVNLPGACRRLAALFCVIVLMTDSAFFASAQTASTGTVSGRVFNPRTGEYVRNAEVRVEGSTQEAVTGTGGTFRLSNVPAGMAELVVYYVGEEKARSSTQVVAGQNTELELNFSTPVASETTEDGVIEMTEFVVSAELEGNVKALADQRNSMDLGRSIASDVFGDVTEGNVGEFLKYLPGIEMDYVEAVARGPRLGGMDAEYTGVSVDGMKQASADGYIQYNAGDNRSTSGGGGRSFSFEQISINAIESIEISRVTPANLDADAPAGTINMKTKRAFDRKGRQISWSVGTGLNSHEFTLKKTLGPDDQGVARKFKPTVSFNFADSFLNNRLGVLFGYSQSNIYLEQFRAEHTYQRTPSTADPRPQVLTQVRFKDGPKWTNRTNYTGTLDWKATDDLIFSLSAVFNVFEDNWYNRDVDFRASANTTSTSNGRSLAGGDGLTTFSTNSASSGSASNRYVRVAGGNGNKQTDSYSISPKVEWRIGNLLVEGALSKSYSDNTYDTLRKGRAALARTNNLTNVQFSATRSDPLSADWHFVQTGGADWANLASRTNPGITNDTRQVTDDIEIAALDFTYTVPSKLPLVLRWGAKYREQQTNTDRDNLINEWNYIGPGGGTTGSWAAYPSNFVYNPRAFGVRFESIGGGGAPALADTEALGLLYQSNPEYFVRSFSAANYYTANFANRRRFTETVPAAYVMANSQWRNLTFQGGLRWEDTETNSREFDPLSTDEVRAAGFAVDSNGRATTVAGLDYQYRTKPEVDRKGSYDRLFPSISAKYRLGENWIFDLGAGQSIRRPEMVRLVGLYSINDDTEIITASNPGLLPEYAERIAGSAAYYFGGSNNVTLTLSDTQIENLFISDEFTAEEFGIDDAQYANYIVRSTRNGEDKVTFRSLEFSYRQHLGFLPGFLQGTSVFANYTRTYADTRRPGLSPHVVTGGVDMRFGRLGMGVKGVWTDETPWTSTVGRIRQSRLMLDGSVDLRLTNSITAFMQVRNITNEDEVVYEAIGDNVPVLWRRQNFGASYVFGLRGRF